MTVLSRDRLLAAALVVATVLLAVVALLRGPLPLPVLSRFGGPPVLLAVMQGTAAVVVPLALVAVVAVLRATGRLQRSAVLLAQGAAAPILLVVVARLNGVVEATSLVLVYACAGGAVLLRWAQTRTDDPLPMRLEAVLGIVPWGVVAFAQVGSGIAGTPPPVSVRVLTLLVLAAAVLEWIAAARRRPEPATWTGLALVALPALLGAAAVLLLVH